MEHAVSTQRNRIHPYKFNLWVGLAAIVMMFAGFTSAYIVMQSRSTWVSFELPHIFWFSTAIIIISSGTMYLAVKSFKLHNINRYKLLITLTAALGLILLLLQYMGIVKLYRKGITSSWTVSA